MVLGAPPVEIPAVRQDGRLRMKSGKREARKRNQEEIEIPPEMWQRIFSSFETPLFLEDMSEVLAALDEVRAQGITDFSAWVEAHPEFITRAMDLVRVLEASDYAVKWFGAADKAELINSVARVVLPETLPALKQLLADLFEGKRFHSCECQFRSLDGRHLYSLNQALLPGPGDVPPLLVLSTVDITDLKLAQQELNTSRERYSHLVEAARDMILCHDISGRITFINQAGLDISGWSRQQIMGQDVELLFPGSGSGNRRKKKSVSLGKSRGRNLYEATMVTRSGRKLPVEVNATVFPDLDGSEGESTVLAMIRDISDRKETENKQRELENRLKETQKMESLGMLAGRIAHDFNNLLVTIMGNAELLLGGEFDPREVHNGLNLIMEASTQAADLCRQMQAYAGQAVVETAAGDLNAIVGSMSSLLRVTVSGKAHIGFQLQPDLPQVNLDAGQITQVIMNLVKNASDSLGDSGGEIVVRTGHGFFGEEDLKRGQHPSLLQPGNYVFCEVTDSGCGMDRETVGRLFDPFFTTKTRNRGLGMSTALGIIQGHRGGFLVDSRPGKGTAVTFLLPVVQWTKSATKGKHPKEPDNLHLNLTGKTVLAVDEDAAVRAVGEGFLRRLGCNVLLASNGTDAVRIFGGRHQDIDAVLLDLTMEGMDGVETCRRLRVIRPDLPVIFTSGFTAEEFRRRAAEVGDYFFVSKPFRLDRIRSILVDALDSGESG